MKKSLKNDESFWLYGKHTCISAIKNENRKCIKLLLTEKFYKKYKKEILKYIKKNTKINLVKNKKTINKIIFRNVKNQGIALKVFPISHSNIENFGEMISSKNSSTIVILDQITDTYNIGSILRTSACFKVDVVILPYKNSPKENSSIAKAASGALDIIPLIRVTNIVKTIKFLKSLGYLCYGFDRNSKKNMNEIKNFEKKIVIIFGSEDKGIRNLVKKNCDYLLKIPMSNIIESLNVSNASAIVLYSLYIKNNYNNFK